MDGEGVGNLIDRDSIYRISYQNMDSARLDKIEISAHVLTPQGIELHSIISSGIDPEYLGMIAKFLNEKKQCVLEQASITLRTDDFTLHGPWKLIEPYVP